MVILCYRPFFYQQYNLCSSQRKSAVFLRCFSFSPFVSSACIFCATPKSVGNCKKKQRPIPRKRKKSPKKKLLRVPPRKSPFTISLKRNNGAPSQSTANRKKYGSNNRIFSFNPYLYPAFYFSAVLEINSPDLSSKRSKLPPSVQRRSKW